VNMKWKHAHSPELPSDDPCYEVNTDLWEAFRDSFRARFGFGPAEKPIYTEAFCAQWMDHEVPVEQ